MQGKCHEISLEKKAGRQVSANTSPTSVFLSACIYSNDSVPGISGYTQQTYVTLHFSVILLPICPQCKYQQHLKTVRMGAGKSYVPSGSNQSSPKSVSPLGPRFFPPASLLHRLPGLQHCHAVTLMIWKCFTTQSTFTLSLVSLSTCELVVNSSEIGQN